MASKPGGNIRPQGIGMPSRTIVNHSTAPGSWASRYSAADRGEACRAGAGGLRDQLTGLARVGHDRRDAGSVGRDIDAVEQLSLRANDLRLAVAVG